MSPSLFLCTAFLAFLPKTSLETPSNFVGFSDARVGNPGTGAGAVPAAAGEGHGPELLPVETVKLSAKVGPRKLSCFFLTSHLGEEFDLFFLAEPWLKDKRHRREPKAGDYLFSVVERAEDPSIISKLTAKEEQSNKAKFRLKSFLDEQPMDDDGHESVHSSEYQICLDTRKVSSETVFTVALTKFEPVKTMPMATHEATEDHEAIFPDLQFDLDDGGQMTVKPQELTERLKGSLDKLSQSLRVAHYTLYERRQIEHHSRVQAENNYELVNRWSFIQVVLMLITSFVQIITIKSLFEERSFFRDFLITFSNERYY